MKNFLRFAFVLILVLSSVPAAFAQDGDDVDTGHIDRLQAFLGLPSLISFRVRVTVPVAEVEEITLTLEQENGFIQRIPLELEESLLTDFDFAAEYVLNWEFERANNLQFFALLTYRFDVLTADGETSTAEDSIIVEHQGVGEWESISNDDIALYWSTPSFTGEGQLEELSETLEILQSYSNFDDPLAFAIYDLDPEFCQELPNAETGELESVVTVVGERFQCDPDDMLILYERANVIPIIPTNMGFTPMSDTLTLALVNHVYSNQWVSADIPAWFLTGLPVLYTRTGNRRALGNTQRAALEDRLLTLNQMNTLPDEATDTELWEGQAYLLTLYLAEQYGAETPFEIGAVISAETSFEQALVDITGNTIDGIYRGWAIWMTTDAPSDVIFWNPYLDATPTPMPTRTPRATLPPATPVPTATITLTPTDRPLRTPEPERATRELLPTATATASTTPLPSGGLDTPANNPTDSSSGDESNGICGTGIGAMILPAFGLIFAWRRRQTHD